MEEVQSMPIGMLSVVLAKWKVYQSGWKFIRVYYHLMLTLQKKNEYFVLFAARVVKWT